MLLVCATVTSIAFPKVQVKGAEASTLFSESFSEATYGTAGSIAVVEPWIQEGSDSSSVSTHNSIFKSAPNGVKVDKTDAISTKISTTGCENIVVGFWYRCSSINSGKAVFEYSVDDGSSWTSIFNVDVKTDKAGVDKEVTLDSKANDQANLILRLKTDSLDGNTYFDDIKVTGTTKGSGTPTATITPVATPVPAATAAPTTAATAAPTKVTFKDVPNDMWAKSYIEKITADGVVIPIKNDLFLPDTSITRAEFSALLVKALMLTDTNGSKSFSDVKAGDWYETAILSAVKSGIIKGFEDGTFKPNDNLSRQDMGVIVANAMKIAKGIETLSETKDFLIFVDNSKIENYAQKAVATAVKYGVIGGKPGKVFDPLNTVTRAEAATVISKLMGKLDPVTLPDLNQKPTSNVPADGSEYSTEDMPEAANIGEDKTWYHDVVVGKGGDRVLKMEIVTPKQKPEKPMPVIVYIYGGGWNHGSKDDHVNKLAGYVDKGYIGVALEYRLTDAAIFPGQLEDCKLAIRYLRANGDKYFMDTDRIGVWGSSSGSHLAALLGTTGDVKELEGTGGWQEYSSRVQAVVDWYGPADFTTEFANNWSSVSKLLGKNAFAVPEIAKSAMPGTYASKDDPPFLVMHGDSDKTVPYYDSVAFAQDLKRAGVNLTFKIVKGAPHGFAGFPDASVMAWDFLEKNLKNK